MSKKLIIIIAVVVVVIVVAGGGYYYYIGNKPAEPVSVPATAPATSGQSN